MKLGIVGSGFVGSSVINGFNRPEVEQWVVDPKKTTTTMDELINAKPEIVFVCVPTPNTENGEVDISIVFDVLEQMHYKRYKGIVVLKSTITPDLLESLTRIYPDLRIIYNPEFLTAQNAWADFLNPPMQILGGDWDDCIQVEKAYVEHSNVKIVPTFKTDLTSASLIKYTINAWLATKVVFMNELHLLHARANCETSWDQFTEMLSTDLRIGNSHMQVPGPDHSYGFGGACFPKDTQALLNFASRYLEQELSVLDQAVARNNELRQEKHHK